MGRFREWFTDDGREDEPDDEDDWMAMDDRDEPEKEEVTRKIPVERLTFTYQSGKEETVKSVGLWKEDHKYEVAHDVETILADLRGSWASRYNFHKTRDGHYRIYPREGSMKHFPFAMLAEPPARSEIGYVELDILKPVNDPATVLARSAGKTIEDIRVEYQDE